MKLICTECKWQGTVSQVLTAPNPFATPGETIQGCPDCKTPECFRMACDVPGCWQLVSCGTPTKAGYRHTCSTHRPKE